jgi:tetratricopeptide (TPR) repeat protein
MLFDLRSAGRRRTVKTVYLGLALLMFVGFVGFSIGSSGLSGGIVDAITGNNGSGGGDTAATKRLTDQIQAAQRKADASPSEPANWAELARARLRFASVGDNFDAAKSDYTPAGKRQLTAAGTAWDKYLALDPKNLDEGLARQMIQAYLSLNKADKAVSAQEIVTQVDPTQQTFTNLAVYAYQANQTRKADLAAKKAISLAPKSDRKDLKSQLDQLKSQALGQQLQQAQPTPTVTIG